MYPVLLPLAHLCFETMPIIIIIVLKLILLIVCIELPSLQTNPHSSLELLCWTCVVVDS